MRTDTIDDFLTRLAGRVPAPGGGATAALHAAQAAALVAMVARYSDSAKFADHAEQITTITATADRLRENALALAEEDAVAFTAVTQASDSRRGPPTGPRRGPGRSHRPWSPRLTCRRSSSPSPSR